MKLRDTIHRRLPEHLLLLVVFLALLWGSARSADADLIALLGNTDQMVEVLKRLASPDWSYIPKVLPSLIETIQMAIAGTALGVAFAIPVAFIATTEMTGMRWLTMLTRGVLNLIRTIPDLLLAAMFLAVFGIGPFTGMMALAVFTFGMVSKLVYESIDTIDSAPIEAFQAVGASRPLIAVHAVMPQVRPNIISYSLYALEINVRASTILGYIGAGGIGVALQSTMNLMRYDRVSIIIIVIFIVVMVIDLVSAWARRRFL